MLTGADLDVERIGERVRERQCQQRRKYDDHEIHERCAGPRLGFLVIDGQRHHQDDGRVDQPVRIEGDSPDVELDVLLADGDIDKAEWIAQMEAVNNGGRLVLAGERLRWRIENYQNRERC